MDALTFRLRFPKAYAAHLKYYLSHFSDSLPVELANSLVERQSGSWTGCGSGTSGLFGQALTQEGVALVAQLADFLARPENASKEGLFRISGSAPRMETLKEALGRGESVDLSAYNPCDVADVLKAYLGKLPETILSEAHGPVYEEELLVWKDESMMTRAQISTSKMRKINLLRVLFMLLPGENRDVLRAVLDLGNVVAKTDGNRMTLDAMAICFMPSLFRFSARQPRADCSPEVKLTRLMLEFAPSLFQPPTELLEQMRLDFAKRRARLDNDVRLGHRLPSKGRLDSDGAIAKPGDGVELSGTAAICDQGRSQKDAVYYNTELEMARLHAHIARMPDCKEKTRLLKEIRNQSRGNLGLTEKSLRERTTPKHSLRRLFKPLQHLTPSAHVKSPEHDEAGGRDRRSALEGTPGTPKSAFSLQDLLDREDRRLAVAANNFSGWRSTDCLLEDGDAIGLGHPIASSSLLHDPTEPQRLDLDATDEADDVFLSEGVAALGIDTRYIPHTDHNASVLVTHF